MLIFAIKMKLYNVAPTSSVVRTCFEYHIMMSAHCQLIKGIREMLHLNPFTLTPLWICEEETHHHFSSYSTCNPMTLYIIVHGAHQHFSACCIMHNYPRSLSCQVKTGFYTTSVQQFSGNAEHCQLPTVYVCYCHRDIIYSQWFHFCIA